MSRTQTSLRALTTVAGVTLALLLLGGIARAQTEGIDLMRQITAQWVKPNIMLVVDRSGSTAWTVDGDDSYLFSAPRYRFIDGSWQLVPWNSRFDLNADYSVDAGSLPEYGTGHGYWGRLSYPGSDGATVYRWYFIPPSRMAIIKNTLGNSITIYDVASSVTPAGTDSYGHPYYEFASGTGPDSGTGAWYDRSANTWHNWTGVASGLEPIPDASYTDATTPLDLVGNLSDVINFGLIAFSGDNCSYPANTTIDVNPDDDDQGNTVAVIEDLLGPDNVTGPTGNSGLRSDGRTPTRAALRLASERLVTDSDSTFNNDPKGGCNRTYGVILMTDGASNYCNIDNNEWNACTTHTTPDDGTEWEGRPPYYSDYLLGLTAKSVRTWVIGVSQAVNACELNYTAYKGGTDASNPDSARTDFNASTDPFAYFTSSALELQKAYSDIIASIGAGDYTTGNPVVSAGETAFGTGGLAFLPSTDYPSWGGHLRAFQIDECDPDAAAWEYADCGAWDASTAMGPDASSVYNNGFTRRIYTWNPTSNALIQLSSNASGMANLVTTLQGLCSCAIDEQVVDFMLGNDGNVSYNTDGDYDGPGSPRDEVLGAMINSTPAVIGAPELWEQLSDEDELAARKTFEATYATGRQGLVWVGTSDGAIRAFDTYDGAEIICLFPPTQLAKQLELYTVYANNPSENPLGQEKLPSDHLYGVASSPRYAELYFESEDEFRTVMFVTEGPGGSAIYAVDVTHPYPGRTIDSVTIDPDVNYGYGETTDPPPVKVLWTKTNADLPGLGETWSVPAVGKVDVGEWRLLVGAGWTSNEANAIVPNVYFLDPITGDWSLGTQAKSLEALANRASSYVGNQAFAPSVFWKNDSNFFASDNIANEGVQSDLNGQLWAITTPSAGADKEAILTLTETEPLYFSPAVAGFPSYDIGSGSPTYSIYAFSSGSYYEISDAISGPDVGTAGNFIPKLYLAARDIATGTIGAAQFKAIVTSDIYEWEYNDVSETWIRQTNQLGPRTVATGPPALFIPADGAFDIDGTALMPFAVWVLYDPDAVDAAGYNCIGRSYLTLVQFDPESLSTLNPADDVKAFQAGEGIATGPTIHGEDVFVGQSDPGEGGEAKLVKLPDVKLPIGSTAEPGDVNWWTELW